jgi:hypothetical protein
MQDKITGISVNVSSKRSDNVTGLEVNQPLTINVGHNNGWLFKIVEFVKKHFSLQ